MPLTSFTPILFRSPWRVRMMVTGLLVAYGIMSYAASWGKGVSFDEAEQLAVGYNFWRRHDFRMESGNGDLVKRWATLPYLVTRPVLPSKEGAAWQKGEPYAFGYEFFFSCGNQPEDLLRQGRAMAVLLGVGLGLLVFACSRAAFGDLGGLVSLTVYAFSPHMLAFGALVSTEISICLTLLGATWCVWRLLHRVTWGRVLASLAMCALLVLAKPSALVILPITLVLIGVKLAWGPPLEWALTRAPRAIASRGRQALVFGGLILLHAVVGWGAIWTHYEFRYLASPDPNDERLVFRPQLNADPVGPLPNAFLTWSRRTHFLPRGLLYETRRLLAHDEVRAAFLHGQWKLGGWRSFFPYAIGVKTSPALWLLLVTGGVSWAWLWRTGRAERTGGVVRSPPLYELAPWLTLLVVYLGVAMMQNLNIGHRHVLPIYPSMYVLAGSAALVAQTPVRWVQTGLVLVLLLLAGESLRMFPHYLGYFSPVVGGPEHGYRHLVDSSVDWGMDLPALKRWLAEHHDGTKEPFYLSYFGTDRPEHYGIQAHRLPGFFDLRPREIFPYRPGLYAISATLAQSVYTTPGGPWNRVYEEAYQTGLNYMNQLERTAQDPAARAALVAEHPAAFWDEQYDAFEKLRFGRLCAWLRHHGEPDDQVGYSILLWRLNATELKAALFGPPPEMAEAPSAGR